MYLTRAFLNPESEAVRVDLRSPEDLHRTVMRAFPLVDSSSPRAAHAVLHRVDHERDGRIVLLIQSAAEPAVDRWPPGYVLDLGADLDLAFSNVGQNPAIRPWALSADAICVESRYIFRLRANTTRKIDTKSGPDGVRRNGRRVPVRGDDGRLAWLLRRAASSGFAIDTDRLRITELPALGGRGHKSITLAGALFEGVLTITDCDRFASAVREGLGPGKAYGYGLLSLRKCS